MTDKGKTSKKIKGLSWSVDSWEHFPAHQQPSYPCDKSYEQVLSQLKKSSPLVDVAGVQRLKSWMLAAYQQRVFLLQGGDCAEDFEKNSAKYIHGQCHLLTQLATRLESLLQSPVVRIGRLAGQYAKPRTLQMETAASGHEQWTFRGHNINSHESCAIQRQPDPQRLIQGHEHAQNAIDWVREFEEGLLDTQAQNEIFTSHEGLFLPLEAAQTYYDEQDQVAYNLSSHMQWLGERTRHLEGAHVEYFRGIGNPIGLKVGPDADPLEIVKLLNRLNPYRHPGRIMLITRMGAQRIAKVLPALIQAVQTSLHPVVWSCDPMHGNGRVNPNGEKTRLLEDIWTELKCCFDLHTEMGSHLSGVHLEMTHEPVLECIGHTSDAQMPLGYQSLCDPRLNARQAHSLIEEFGEHVVRHPRPKTYPGMSHRVVQPYSQRATAL